MFHNINHDDGIGPLHCHPEPRVFGDLPVDPDLVQSDPPEVRRKKAVGGNENVGDHLPGKLLLPLLQMESQEVHEAIKEVFGPGPGEVLDVRVLPQLQLPGVDELDDGAKRLLTNILFEDLAVPGGVEDTGLQHRRSSAEDVPVDPERLGLTSDGAVSGVDILHDGLPQTGAGLLDAAL